MSFSKQLKLIRETNHVTQQELADFLNVSRTTIGGYETKNKEPNYDIIVKIANYFHVSTDFLLTGQEVSVSSSKELQLIHSLLQNSSNNTKADMVQLLKLSSIMNKSDLNRLLEYAELLLLQPHYEKKQQKNSNGTVKI